MADLQRGTVKWFNDAKGFGFIEMGPGKDVFVHYSVIETEGFKTLKDGEIVEYELKEGEKGLHAARVLRPMKLEEAMTAATEAQNTIVQDAQSAMRVQTLTLPVEASAEQAK
jgi:cold shock protein